MNCSSGIALSEVSWVGPHTYIIHNNIQHNKIGIYFGEGGSGTVVKSNNISNNEYGVVATELVSGGNRIYHNNFLNNIVQVKIDSSFNYKWDNGYPSGGNYWSDHASVDVKKGSHQNLTGSDGIVDNPYVIDANNTDRYPLVNPYVPLFGDLNDDRQVDIRDIAIAALAFGSYPGHPRWNIQADINQDNKVDIRDLILIARSFGKTNP